MIRGSFVLRRWTFVNVFMITTCLGLASCSAILGIGDLPPDDGSSQGSNSDGGASESGSDGSSSRQGDSSGNDSTPTLVADWLLKLQTGEDEINMTSTSAGHAQLYWYDSGEAQWQVSAQDNGSGSATLTLACVSSDCASADNIVYDCTYTLIELKCTGLSGGISDNYKGDQLNLTKQ
jgi:hypothetical protein